MRKIVSVNELKFFGNEINYLKKCINQGWISSEGPFVENFEKKFSNVVNRKFASSVCNGSVALDVAIKALGLRKNDEVIIPAFTIISCCNAVIKNNLKPVLVDCDLETWNMDVNKIEKLINKNTKAIMVVHIYGLTVNMDPIIHLAKKYKLKIIEDAAEAHGQKYYNKPCGSFGDISTFSFYANKHITTGEGGMILTDNKVYYERIKKIKNLHFGNGLKRFVHLDIGYNYRMGSLQAAYGLSQIRNLNKIIRIKKSLGQHYNYLLSDLREFLYLPKSSTEYCENHYWVYGVVLKKKVNTNVNKIIKFLTKKKISCRPFFTPMNLQPIYKKLKLFNNVKIKNANYISQNGFYLPSGVGTTLDQIYYVSQNLKKFFSI